MTLSSFHVDPTPDAGAGIPADGRSAAPRSVRGWALRVSLGAATLAASVIVILSAPPIGAIALMEVLLVMAALGTALAPGSVLPLAVMIGVVAFRVASSGPVLDAALIALVALLPLIHQMAGVCAAIPARSTCYVSALRPAMIRYAIAVVPVELVVGIVLVFG
ncbi:MAG: hypothetical protein ABI382_06540 [Nakamurella sp.]